MAEDRSVAYLTEALAAETNRRAEVLQQHAFEASSKLLNGEDVDFFVVSREYHSGLFYGFLTNVPFGTIPPIVAEIAVKSGVTKPSDSNGGIVGSFRDVFTKSFGRPGPLRTLSDLLNREDAFGCSAIAVLFDGSSNPCGTRFFDSDLNAIDPPPELFVEILSSEVLSDDAISKVATVIAAQKTSCEARATKAGFCLIVSANQHISDAESIRRKPLQLMQIMLQVGIKPEALAAGNWTLSNDMKSVLISSSVAAFSVLYERERYFEKAIRQSIKGTMIKWGDKDSVAEFSDQIKALHQCNEKLPSHAAPFILKYGFQARLDPIPLDPRNMDKEAHYPWYEMVRYSLPSLDDVLTTTPGLQDFEVRAIAKAVLEHLEVHFWRFDDGRTSEISFKDVPMVAIPALTFATLRRELTHNRDNKGSIEKIRSRIGQWRNGVPVQAEKKGLTIPSKNWTESHGSLWRAFLDNGSAKKLSAKFCDENGSCLESFPISDPYQLLIGLTAAWNDGEPTSYRISVPKFLTANCHGDPHFENIFIDASIPEDPFIVAIDPATRKYNGDAAAGVGLDQAISCMIIDGFGQQPMHDISKLLLSTTGGYALALKNGFAGKLEKSEQNGSDQIYTLKWQSKDSISPLGAEATGVSGANLYMRSVSATSDAKRYQYVFGKEVLNHFDHLVDKLLIASKVESDEDKIICRNIYYIQIWAWTVRHTFSIAEKLFPDRDEISDQLLVFGSYLLHFGAKYLRDKGPTCLNDKATHERFKELLSLHDIMEQNHAK